MDWIKLYTEKWLRGSSRDMSAEHRAVWIDLLALAAESKLRDGTLRWGEGKPMTLQYIADILRIDISVLMNALDAYQQDTNIDDGKPRVTVWNDGTIEITNWHKYQDKPERITKKQLADSAEAAARKQVAIEKAKKTKDSRDNAVVALTRTVNVLNMTTLQLNHKVAFIPVARGEINGAVNAESGEVIDVMPVDDKKDDEAELTQLENDYKAKNGHYPDCPK